MYSGCDLPLVVADFRRGLRKEKGNEVVLFVFVKLLAAFRRGSKSDKYHIFIPRGPHWGIGRAIYYPIKGIINTLLLIIIHL